MLAPAEDPAAKVFEWPLLTGALARGHAIATQNVLAVRRPTGGVSAQARDPH
jgi:hypothetical protein